MAVLEQAATYSCPLILATAGVGTAIDGARSISSGDLAQGAKKIVYGLTLTHFGARFFGFTDTISQGLMKYSLGQGIALGALDGMVQVARGLSQRNIIQVFKGIAQSGMGALGFFSCCHLDAKILCFAQQALLLALASSHILKSGLSDLSKENYKIGVCKLLLGAGGLAGVGYSAYLQVLDQMSNSQARDLTLKQSAFIETHEREIESIYEKGRVPSGSSWKELGNGNIKTAYSHPELDGIIKTIDPNQNKKGEDENAYYTNLQEAKELVQDLGYRHIKIPISNLVETSKGYPILVEEKLDLVPYNQIPDGIAKTEAEAELDDFLMTFGLCDVDVEINKNAGFLNPKDANDSLKIGLYDFDCHESDHARTVKESRLVEFAQIIATCSGLWMDALGRITQAIVGKRVKELVWIAGAAGAAALIAHNSEDFSDKDSVVKGAIFEVGKGASIIASLTAASAMGLYLASKIYTYGSKILLNPRLRGQADS